MLDGLPSHNGSFIDKLLSRSRGFLVFLQGTHAVPDSEAPESKSTQTHTAAGDSL